ncbi:hypothetical protein P280DRAFT_547182 [Massarina eburnea CBS 473.64]|uniref:Uncharacterized protein n=1 Tax=Massarina eburnea CBS 473.64 TaxID=1395130 RepID=A0A6A6S927_9PLEO|nr:hypothetical protein P280DRAFT_547182 [Massarina eburnea CBS 473.64]
MNNVAPCQEGSLPTIRTPKLFTPLAAARIGSTRFLFYVDENNMVRGVQSTDTPQPPWKEEPSLSAMQIHCAHYSQLAASTLEKSNAQTICLYYQTANQNGAIQMLRYSNTTEKWDSEDTESTPTVFDDLLRGTSITALPMRSGLHAPLDSPLPVVYLQSKTLKLAHSQGNQVEIMRSLGLTFAPNTSFAIVDDGHNLCFFYTSSHSNHLKSIVIKDGKASTPWKVATPTPRSAIAAVRPTKDRIVLFYQSLNCETGSVELASMTFRMVSTTSETQTKPTNLWPVSHAKFTKLA